MFKIERKPKFNTNLYQPSPAEKITQTLKTAGVLGLAKKVWQNRKARASLAAAILLIGGYFTWTHGRLLPISDEAILAAQTKSPLPPEWLDRYFRKNYCTRDNYCGPKADPDRDGLTNYEEFLYFSDPTNPDTNANGSKDGEDVRQLRNPASSTIATSARDINNIYDYNPLTDAIIQEGIKAINKGEVMSIDQIQASAARIIDFPKFEEIPFKVTFDNNQKGIDSYVDLVTRLTAQQREDQAAGLGQNVTSITDQNSVQSFIEAMAYYSTALTYIDTPLDVFPFHKALYASLVFQGVSAQTQKDFLEGKISQEDAQAQFQMWTIYYTRALQDMNTAATELQKKYKFSLTVN